MILKPDHLRSLNYAMSRTLNAMLLDDCVICQEKEIIYVTIDCEQKEPPPFIPIMLEVL
jgi:hypothetical protein